MTLKTTISGVEYEVSVDEDFQFTTLVGDWAVSGDSLPRLRREIERAITEIEKAGKDFAFQPRQVYNSYGAKTIIRGIHERDRNLLITTEHGDKTSSNRVDTHYALNETVRLLLEQKAEIRAQLKEVNEKLAPHKVALPYFSTGKSILAHLLSLDVAITKAEEGISAE